MSFFRSNRIAGIIGNLLEHYDSALFGLLAPFIAPLFFAERDPVIALILTYGMLPLGFLARPLGSLFFGWIGDRFGRKEALFCSLSGMAFATVAMGSLPLYRDIGGCAPFLLAVGRMVQGFCAAGESSGGAIFVLEHTEKAKRGLISSIYDASSIGGILIASGFVTFLSSQDWVELYWRFLFWLGGGTALFGLLIRLQAQEGADFVRAPQVNTGNVLRECRGALGAIVLASGFSYTTYSLAFTLMNGYVPLVTSLSKTEVMEINTVLLIADLVLLPFFGCLANRWGKRRVMFFGAISSACGAVPLFCLLESATLGTVIFVRIAIIVFGVSFAAPYHAWALEQVPSRHRYLILSFGSALGSQLIGMPTAAICLWLYQMSGRSFAPGLYLMAAALGAIYVLARKSTGSDLEQKLKQQVVKKIGILARLERIIFLADLPKPRSGKIMQWLLWDIAKGRVTGDVTTLADQGVIEEIKKIYQED